MAGTRQQSEHQQSWGPSSATAAGENACQSLGSTAHARTAFSFVTEFETEAGAIKLARMIEGEIIPRLMLAHRCEGAFAKSAVSGPKSLMPDDVAELARIVVEHDVRIACAYIEALRCQGVSMETIFLDLISPAAQLLGDMWVADLTDFTEVTIGLSQLQHLLHHFGPAFENESETVFCPSRALLVAMPGDQHTFGISMVEEFFRRAGWDVKGGHFENCSDHVKVVRNETFDLIGLSVSSDLLLGDLTSVIAELRKASRNKQIRIVVGGRLFVEHPDFAELVGADGTAADARRAVLQLAVPMVPGRISAR